MKTTGKWQCLGKIGLGLALGALAGCQTWVAGMTLPSGHYLQHTPQYIPPSPPFPLTRELASMEDTNLRGQPAGAPLPAPVAPAPAPVP